MRHGKTPPVDSPTAAEPAKTQQSTVPKIRVGLTGSIYSDATLPRHIPDTCASWPPATLRTVKRLLKSGKTVQCADATAYAAVTSLALVLLLEGNNVTNSQIERAYV